VAALGTVAAGLIVVAPTASASPPPNPTNADIQAAAHSKDKLAGIVGVINGKIAQQKILIQQQANTLQRAEQLVSLRLEQEQTAKNKAAAARTKEKKAKGKVTAAAAKVAKAHTDYVNYVQAAYYDDSSTDDGAGSLLTASDPSEVLERSSLITYQAQNKANAVGEMQTAQIVKSNAEAVARRAQIAATTAQTKAENASAAAQQAVAAAQADYRSSQATQNSMQAELSSQETLLNSAQSQLATLNGQRARYNAYQAHQRALARAAAAKRARELAAERARHQSSGGGGGGSSYSGGGGGGSAPAAPSGGSWTAAKGRKAVNRAMSTLGTIYIWAGGNKWGPTTGGCTDPVSPCGTMGYDCSGLVLYAWGANWAHYAATQYSQAGSYHPSAGNFMPGDLLFWSDNGTQGGIGHVAIYIGNGNVIQAPQSGDVVKITPWQQVEYGYYGATRPLT